jgi:hypothetical protein
VYHCASYDGLVQMWLARVGIAFVFVTMVAAFSVEAQTWVDYATVSMTNATTAKLTASRMCYTDGTDIACDASAGLITTSGTVLFGNVSATNLYASNASLTTLYVGGVAVTGGATGDRITSGTASAIANTSGGYISLTTGATTWGYLGSSATYLPVANGVTANFNAISATSAIQVGGNSLTCASGISGTMRYSTTSSTMEYCNGTAWTSMGPSSTAPISFHVNKGGTDQTVVNGATTLTTWSTEVFDSNNNFTSNRFTATVAGTYLFSTSVYCSDDTTTCAAYIYKNGSVVARGVDRGSSDVDNVVWIGRLGVGDYVEVYGRNDGGTTLSGVSELSYFNGALIGPQANAGGGATPAGNPADVQYNSGGVLAADTGVFTYSAGVLKATTISTTNAYASTASFTTLYVGGVAVTGSSNGDRITSGTTSIVAQTASNIISITTSGVNTGYFNSNGVLTLPGISATANLTSVTSLYASGNVGIGTAWPSDTTHIYNNSNASLGLRVENHSSGAGAYSRVMLMNDTGVQGGLLMNSSGNSQYAGANGLAMGTFGSGPLVLYTNNVSRVTIDVNGNVSATGPIKIGTSALTCSSAISGTVRYNTVSNTMEYCNSSTWANMGPSATTPVSFMVNKNGTNQTVTTNTYTKLTWGNEVFDTNNNFASDRFTPTVPGKYLFNLNVYCSDNPANSYCAAGIYKNGTLISQADGNFGSGGGGIGQTTVILDMNGSTDYVEGWGNNNGGVTIHGATPYTYFDGVLLAPQGGGAGGATPAGSTADVQYNSGGALAADTGVFTYSSGILRATTISATNVYAGSVSSTTGMFGTTTATTTSGTYHYGNTASFTTLYVGGVAVTGSSSGDRITSGTNSIVAQTASNIISITTNNVNTGYFNSNGVLTLPGISATANLTSVTSLYASGKVAVGLTSPNTFVAMDVSGSIRTASGLYVDRNGGGLTNYVQLLARNAGSTGSFGNAGGNGQIELTAVSTSLVVGTYDVFPLIFGTNNTERMRIDATGNVSATGPVRIGTSALTCSSAVSGTIRFNSVSNTMEYCNSTAWTPTSAVSSSIPSFLVTLGGSTAPVTTNTFSRVPFSTEVFDTNNNFASSRFTATVPGKYIFTTHIRCTDATNGCEAALYKNGAAVAMGPYAVGLNWSTASIVVDMNGSSDYVEAYVWNGGGTTVGGSVAESNFSGSLLTASLSLSGGGGATPAGSTNDVQYNSAGSLGADTGVFTYSGGVLRATTVSTTNAYANTASFTTLYVGGVAVTGGGSSGDRITSGTASVIANTTGGYISLTTGATTWGYLGSSATYIPTLNANILSGTTILGTLSTAAQPNITSLGTLPTLTVGTGTFTNVLASTVSSSAGTFTNIGGTLSTIAQPNITSLGLLTGISTSAGAIISGTYHYGQYGSFTTVTAGTFIGNGAGITGLTAAATDRISTSGVASGATLGMVVADKGTISFTTGGVAGTAYLSTGGILVGPGISATTNQTSVTTLYASGNVGIGTNDPSVLLDVKGNNINYLGQLRIQAADYGQITFYNSASPTASQANRLGDIYYDVANRRMVVENQSGTLALNQSGGNVGIGTTTPAYPLEVSGVLNVKGTGNGLQISSRSGTGAAYLYSQGTSDFRVYDTTAGADRFIIAATSGNVGVNTTPAAAAKLAVVSATANSAAAGGTVAASFGHSAYGLTTMPANITAGVATMGTYNSTAGLYSTGVYSQVQTGGHGPYASAAIFDGPDASARMFVMGNPAGGNTRNPINIVNTATSASIFVVSGSNIGIGTAAPFYRTVISNDGAEGLEIAPGNTTNNTFLQFYNRSGAAYTSATFIGSNFIFSPSGTERARINSTGLMVGSGTPAYQFVVSGTSPVMNSHYSGAAAAGNKGQLIFTHLRSSDGTIEQLGYIQGVAENNQSAGGLRFVARNNGDVLAMLISSTGNIGMNNAPTAYTLTVTSKNAGQGAVLGYSQNQGTYGILGYNNAYAFYGAGAVYASGNIRGDGGFTVGGNAGVTGSSGSFCSIPVFTGGIAYTFDASSCNGDISEHYGTEETLHRGEIVVLGSTVASRDFRIGIPSPGETSKTTYTITTANVRKARGADRARIIGAVPTSPFKFSDDKIDLKDNPQEVALVGHVPVHMTLEGGPVAIGDPITIADKTPGAGMKATTSGRILGYALEPYSKAGDSKDGMIEVFIHLEDWQAPADKMAVNSAIADLKAANDNLQKQIDELKAAVRK